MKTINVVTGVYVGFVERIGSDFSIIKLIEDRFAIRFIQYEFCSNTFQVLIILILYGQITTDPIEL